MQDKPLVTIITPSYNHAAYIEQAIQSVVDQTYPYIEYIIIDDGSTDGSHELLGALAKQYPNFTFILHKDNKGHVRINEGVEMASGEYISILSSDDWYLPEKIEKQVQLFQQLDNSYGVVYSTGLRYFMDIDEYRKPITNNAMERGEILESLLTKPFFIYPISPLVRKECFLKYPFSPEYKAEGEAIYFKIAMEYKFDFVEKPLVVMRDHSQNVGKNIKVMLRDNINYRKQLFEHPDFPEVLKYLKGPVLSKIHFLKGWELIRLEQDYALGAENLIKALKLNPKYIFNPRVIFGILSSKIKLIFK